MTPASLRPPPTTWSTAVRRQHQTHPPLLERHAHRGERQQPEGVSDRPVAQRDRIRPIEIDVDGAVRAATNVLDDVLPDGLWLGHLALQWPLIGKSRSTPSGCLRPGRKTLRPP